MEKIAEVAKNAIQNAFINKLLSLSEKEVKYLLVDQSRRFLSLSSKLKLYPHLFGITLDPDRKLFQRTCTNATEELIQWNYHDKRMIERFGEVPPERRTPRGLYEYRTRTYEELKKKGDEVLSLTLEQLTDLGVCDSPFIFSLADNNDHHKRKREVNILDLPFDVIQRVFLGLTDIDLCFGVALTCCRWRRFCEIDSLWALKTKARWKLSAKHSPPSWKRFYISANALHQLSHNAIYYSTFYDDQHFCVQDEVYRLSEMASNGGGGTLTLVLTLEESDRDMFYLPGMKNEEEKIEENEETYIETPEEAYEKPTGTFMLKTECVAHTTSLRFHLFGTYSIHSFSSSFPIALKLKVNKMIAANGGMFSNPKIKKEKIKDKEMILQIGLIAITTEERREEEEKKKIRNNIRRETIEKRLQKEEHKGIRIEDLLGEEKEKEIRNYEKVLRLTGFGQEGIILFGSDNEVYEGNMMHKLFE